MGKKPFLQPEDIVVAVGVVVIVIAIGLWIRSNAQTWSLATLSFGCLTVIGVCLIIAGLVDKRGLKGLSEPDK